MNNKAKVFVAIALALIGLVAVGRLVIRSTPGRETKALAVTEPVPEVVKAVIEGDFDTRPTSDTVYSDIKRASSKLDQLINQENLQIVSPDRESDLTKAFEERMAALLDPDASRDISARQGRGQRAEGEKQSNDSGNSIFALLPLDIRSLEVRVIYQRGRKLVNSGYLEGFRETTTQIKGPNAFPLMELNPESAKLDIVEVRLPMLVPIPPPKDQKTERRLVGFQFVWSQERKQWIPWANKQYGGPNSSGSFGIPF